MKKNGAGIATDSLVLTFVRIITVLVSVIQSMILSRSLTEIAYGTYSQGLLIISVITPFLGLGLNDAINYFYNKSSDEIHRIRYVNTIFCVSLTIGFLGGTILLLFRESVASYFNNPLIFGILVYIVYRPCLNNLIALFQSLYISMKYSKIIAVRNLFVSIIQILIIVISVSITNNVSLIFLLLLIMDLVQVLFLNLFLRKKGLTINPFKGERKIICEILTYSLPVFMAISIGTINTNLDKLMISTLMSVEDYALYANVSKELPFSFIVFSMTSIVTPVVIRLLQEQRMDIFKNVWKNYLEFGYTVTWPLCICAIFFAPQIIEFLYSSLYVTKEGVFIFRVYTFVAMLQFTYFGLIPTALGQTKIILRYSVLGLLINILLNIIFYYCFGMIGPSLATAISVIIPSSMYMCRNSKLVNVKLCEVLNLKNISLFLLLLMCIGMLSKLVYIVLKEMTDNFLLQMIVPIGLYMGLVILFKIKRLGFVMKNLNSSIG